MIKSVEIFSCIFETQLSISEILILIYLLHSPLPLSSFCTDLAVMSRARTYPPMASVAASGVALRHSLPITIPSSISWCNSSSPTGICREHAGFDRSGHKLDSIQLAFHNQGLACKSGKSAFSTNAQSRFASAVFDGVLRPPC